jgi:multidrug efflux system membrane fusion protein
MPVTEPVHPPPSAHQPVDQVTSQMPARNTGGLIRRLLLVLILAGVAALVFWKFKANQREADERTAQTEAAASLPIPVAVAPVASRTMPIYLTELGTVTAFNTVTVKSRVDGQLLSVDVREGQQVHKGQLLAVIDPRPYEAALAQAQGQLTKDQAASDYAKAEASRYTALLEAGVVSKESQQTQISTAGQAEGSIAADRAAIEAAKVNLIYTRITSPIDGVVGLRQVDAGNIVHANDTTGLIVVTQLQPITVIFTLPEDQLPEVLKLLHTGRQLQVEAFDRAQANHLATGAVLTVDNQIDSTTGTVKVKAVFPNADGALFPNQFVNIRLVLQERPGSLVVPASALQTGTNGDFVYIARQCPASGCPQPDNSAHAPRPGDIPPAKLPEIPGPKYFADVAPVKVDLTEGTDVILRSGVSPGDMVITDGQEKLKKFSPISPKQGQ